MANNRYPAQMLGLSGVTGTMSADATNAAGNVVYTESGMLAAKIDLDAALTGNVVVTVPGLAAGDVVVWSVSPVTDVAQITSVVPTANTLTLTIGTMTVDTELSFVRIQSALNESIAASA